MIRNTVLLTVLLCVFINTTNAQNYYPVDVGNIWILESEDGTERITYAIGTTREQFNGESVRTLRITNTVLGTSKANTSTFFIQTDEEGIKIHRILPSLGDVFEVTSLEFSPPATLFPAELGLTKTWEIHGETEVVLVGAVTVSSVNEVVAIEDVKTSERTFKNCVKIQTYTKTTAALGVTRSISYQWLAPDIGPVKFETSQDIVFELVKSNLLPATRLYDVNADGVVNILDLTLVGSRFGSTDAEADVNGDGTVNILDVILVAQNLKN
ncbi:hypothetical protein F4Y59_04370 [Candidatus Poribacteria bacterium]|nr:hypothetical protein [Candidatus Poribacteria bacterium]MYK20626.1 hypothetical protein [Candidatus Poribacteria bacterium]